MYLLDTNVVSELQKLGGRTADTNVVTWAARETTTNCYISAITIMEIEIGVQRLEQRDPARGSKLRAWMDDQLLAEFSGRIIPIDAAITLRCAALHVTTSAPFKDSLIAATALTHGMTVVTRNVSDFVRTGVELLNPWEPRQG